MMKGNQMEHFLEDSPHHNSKLLAVFNKIPHVWQHQHKLATAVIELQDNENACEGDGADDADADACQALARLLEKELRAAKSTQLSCGEVLLPAELLPRVARDVLRMADTEPCGLRGCMLFVNLQTEHVCRRIATIKCDPNTVSTFELYLTLRQDASSWHSLLPQFLKNVTRGGGGTVMISPRFTLDKKKLYRSYLE